MSASYTIRPASITCHRCGLASYNSHDIENRFCGNCKVFHGDVPAPPIKPTVRIRGASFDQPVLADIDFDTVAAAHSFAKVFEGNEHLLVELIINKFERY